MVQKLLGLVEAHIEKGVLAACVLFAAYVAWGYLLGSPNKVEFGGQTLGPGQLHDKMKEDADRLQSAVRSASATDEEGDDVAFQDQLRAKFNTGVFGQSDDQVPVPDALRVTTSFGSKIEVPGVEVEDESVALITPLQPTGIEMSVGRSMIYRQPLLVGLGGEEDAIAEEDAKPVEQPWVTVAGYFDRKAQYQEMINAGYLPFRARVYVVGVDVRRQEIQADGSFSEPEIVARSSAMPVSELPEPQFDDDDGSLTNKMEIDEAFRTVKDRQQVLQQPPFYQVDAGDFWEVPPLEGLDFLTEEDVEEEVDPFRADAGPAPGRRPGAGGLGTGDPGGGRPNAGGFAGGRGGGRPGAGGFAGGRGGGGGFQDSGPSQAQQRAAARREIRQRLETAQEALAAQDFNRARNIANDVVGNDSASGGDKKKAQAILKRADQLEMRATRLGSGGGVAPRASLMGEQISNPESGAPAVWYHDDSVESGKTYRYSMRVRLWNRYVGQTRSMKKPAEARIPVLEGEWSEWGNPVTVTPETYFFVAGAKQSSGEAQCEVWKWRSGSWMKERFEVAVGDVVGGTKTVKTNELDEDLKQVRADVDFTTGVVILDMRLKEKVKQRIPGKGNFSYRDQESVVIVYLDPADGQVKEKAAVFDRNAPLRKTLEEAEL